MDEIELLKRKLERERKARKQAETILESKALDLYNANESLKSLNNNLEQLVNERTNELQESEDRYKSLVERASDIIFNVDEEGYFTFINTSGSKAFGYEAEELIGARYVNFIPLDHRAEIFQYYTELKEKEIKTDYLEFPVQAKDGEIHWLGQNVNRINNADGSFYFSSVARDITQKKLTEIQLEKTKNELLKSEVKYRSILENMELGLMEVDNSGIITRIYDSFNKMTGYSGNELIGKNAIDALLVKGFEEIIQREDEERLKGHPGVYEVKIRKKNGSEIWVLISGAPFFNEKGEVIGSIGVHYDITDRKNLQNELEIAKEKAVKAQMAEKQFLANMSHEIRTPLNAIIGMSHLLADTDLKNDQQDYLNILSSSAGILKNLISDILDISKIDAGTLEINETAFDLQELCDVLIKTISLKNSKKSISFKSIVSDEINNYIVSDKQLLNQILLNLLSNAEKFTQHGKIELHASITHESEDSYSVLFQVMDTGIGITQEESQKIFNKFIQANTGIRENYGGTGLGLSISQKLVKLLGGKLKVKSQPNKGSTFYFELEVKKGTIIESSHTLLKDMPVTIPLGKKILVAEDNTMNLRYITTLLKKWNLKYDVAHNGLEAINQYKHSNYDLIFMDLSMPVMDGYESCKTIRKLEEEKALQRIPIVALTASTFLSKKQLALQAGMSDFISKPFTPDQLLFIIEKYLGSHNRSAETSNTFIYNKKLDHKYLVDSYALDYSYALEMFKTYLEIIEDELILLESKLSDQAQSEFKKYLHKLKPTFTMVGLSFITSEMESLEKEIDHNSITENRAQFIKIKTDILNYLPVIKEEVKRLNKFVSQKISSC